jgi:hypothetical protein
MRVTLYKTPEWHKSLLYRPYVPLTQSEAVAVSYPDVPEKTVQMIREAKPSEVQAILDREFNNF